MILPIPSCLGEPTTLWAIVCNVSNKPKDALMAYLHVDILFYGDSETHAESLYHLGKLWQVAKNQDRAAAAVNLLKQRYAGSVWAEKQ